MKKFYRYELYLDNEYQGVGIFHGLTELNLSEETENQLQQLKRRFQLFILESPLFHRCLNT